MVCGKFQANHCRSLGGDVESWFFTFCDVAKKKSRRKWAWPIPRDSGASPEHVDIRILNIGCTVWKIEAITRLRQLQRPLQENLGNDFRIPAWPPDLTCLQSMKKSYARESPQKGGRAQIRKKKEESILTDTIGPRRPVPLSAARALIMNHFSSLNTSINTQCINKSVS